LDIEDLGMSSPPKTRKAPIELKLYELQVKNYDWLDKKKATKYTLKFKQDLIYDNDILKRKVIETFVDKKNLP
jgi:hypothetical protein